jgi:hypothetical protein
MIEALTIERFSEHVNSKFYLYHNQGPDPVEMELIKVSDLGSTPRQTQFSCVFLARHPAPVFQSVFRVEHEQLGTMEIFLVPIGMSDEGVQLEAIFNRVNLAE